MTQRYQRSFVAHDAAGTRYTIEVWANVLYTPQGGEEEQAPTLRTADGRPVKTVARGRYQVLYSGRRVDVTTDDPDPP